MASDDSDSHVAMGEICPGLWIGNLQSLVELRKKHTSGKKQMSHRRWTVISILHSSRLMRYARQLLLLDAITGGECQQQRAGRLIVERHIEWNLADRPSADFLSSKLDDILNIMDHCIPSNVTNFVDDVVQRTSTACYASPEPTETDTRPPSTACCLIHCAAGESRSAAVCAAWLMSRSQSSSKWAPAATARHNNNGRMSLVTALAQIRSVRPQANPNLGFLAHLRALEQCDGNMAAARARMRPKTTAKGRMLSREERTQNDP